MVAILEKINIHINEDFIMDYTNVYGERCHDYISKADYSIEFGKIYGLICEQGAGGESISRIITYPILEKCSILFNGKENNELYKMSWYVGKPIKEGRLLKKEMTVRKALEMGLQKKGRYNDIETIIEDFHLSSQRLDYTLSEIDTWERWRASIARGFTLGKRIYCFPWMDSLYFYDCMINSLVFRFFKNIVQDNGLIILPTSREQNVKGLADKIIKVQCPRFERCISDSDYFKI